MMSRANGKRSRQNQAGLEQADVPWPLLVEALHVADSPQRLNVAGAALVLSLLPRE
jgi:hypothetical protein